MSKVRVQSPNVRYVDNVIESKYQYSTTRCTTASDGTVQCEPLCTELLFRTDTRVPERLVRNNLKIKFRAPDRFFIEFSALLVVINFS